MRFRRSSRLAFLLAALLAACLSAETAPPSSPPRAYDPVVLERLTLGAANEARVEHGRRPLRPSNTLTHAARAHSADLARAGRLSHTGTDGSSPSDRADRAGAHYEALGENIYQSSLFASHVRTVGPDGVSDRYVWMAPEALAREAVDAWLESPGHRANLLRPDFGRAGTGVAFDDEHGWVVTMDYAD